MTVAVIGDAFVDIIVPAFRVKRGETYYRNIVVHCGGIANVAIQIARLGAEAKFIGKVGNDVLGRYFKGNLKENTVKDLTFVDGKRATGVCLSLTYKDGERAMIASRGANDYLTKEEISKCLDEIVSCKIMYFSGYSLLSNKTSESVLYAIQEARDKGCEIYFNPGAPNIIKPIHLKVIQDLVDILFLNLDEAKTISRKVNISDVANSVSQLVKVATVITLGKDGCLVCTRGNRELITAQAIRAKDTTSAGDAFAAGFIVGRLRNMELIDCAKLANDTARRFLEQKMKVVP